MVRAMSLPGLRPAREDRNLSRRQLAALVGTSETTIKRAENGQGAVGGDVIARLALTLRVSSDVLLGLDPGNDKAPTDASPASPVRA